MASFKPAILTGVRFGHPLHSCNSELPDCWIAGSFKRETNSIIGNNPRDHPVMRSAGIIRKAKTLVPSSAITRCDADIAEDLTLQNEAGEALSRQILLN